MAQSTFERHLAAIQSGEVTRTNVIGIRKAINAAERKANGWSVPRGAMPPAQAWELEAWVEREQPRVVGDLHDSGLTVLRNKRYAKRLAQYADVIEWPDHFELVRFDRIGSRGGYAVPVYRLVGANGGSFKFMNIPWQSGGDGPEILA